MELLAQFRNYLSQKKISPVTVKNYLSDVRHFLKRATGQVLEIAAFDDVLKIDEFFTVQNLEKYKESLERNIPRRTLNRHLSSLRQFGQFLVAESFLSENPAEKIANYQLPIAKKATGDEVILKEFRQHLWEKGASKATMKNYLADTRQFLDWVGKVS